MRNRILSIAFLLSPFISFSQVLFTYGNHKADAKDFVRAFTKNNEQPVANKQQLMQEYLDAYISSRLKIQQAYDLRFDTLPQVVSEVENLRAQIIENYMADPSAIDRLAKEAFTRSQKDIHVAHIYIADNGDTIAMNKKLSSVLAQLQKGTDFLSVAQQLSDDPAAKQNKGDLNYITVFTLPYEFENIVYNTAAGKYSKPYRSMAGYHIFKNLGERKALGKIKIQQILLAFPPNSNDAGKANVAKLADSLYKRIQAGENFGKLAAQFSNDNISSSAEGMVPEITVGQYDPSFEKIIWSLQDGTVSKPIASAYGYHIVKTISHTPIVTKANDSANNQDLKYKVTADDRWKSARDFIYTTVKTKAGLSKLYTSDAVLWALSDSLLEYKSAGIGRAMNLTSPLYKIGDSTLTVTDWLHYAQMNRFRTDRNGLKSYPVLMDEFVKNVLYQYYRQHLEEYNDDFRIQMSEFKDGNIFFEIMQQQVWNKAAVDSAALLSLFEKNKSQYDWKQSADAVLFYCADEATAKAIADKVKQKPADWRKIAEAMNDRVIIDSGRFEWPQIPGLDKKTPTPNLTTAPVVNTNDNTASFAHILKVYTASTPRTFEQAKGLVMNDYQQILEEKWINELKKKYPVTIDEKMFADISK